MKFCATCWMGLENVAEEELSSRPLRAKNIRTVRQLIGEGKRRIFFEAEPNAEALSRVGSAEDIYTVVSTIPECRNARRLASAIEAALSTEEFHDALSLERAVSGRAKPSRFEPLVTTEGRRTPRRRDVREALVQAISGSLPKWKQAERDGLGLWVDADESNAILAVRLKSRRTAKKKEIPGAIPASVAYSMIYLTYPWGGEVFLDPFCGSGTFCIERARFPKAGVILAGDIDIDTIETAVVNLEKLAAMPLRFDAGALPLAEDSVDVIVANPPWVAREESCISGTSRLYELFSLEAARVLRPKGRLAAITTERHALDTAIKKTRAFSISKCFVVNCLGLRPSVFIAHRI